MPGRLLMVQRGTIWLWQGKAGEPLVGGNVYHPRWSPDGTRFAYVERGESYSDLMVANAAGTHLAQLTTNGSRQPSHSVQRVYESRWAFYPAWSPDSLAITYAGQYSPPTGDPAAEFNLSLYRTDAVTGGVVQQLLADTEGHAGVSVYTADGSIVFARAASASGGVQQIYRYTAESAVALPFPGAPTPSYDPALSSDGAWLAFAAQESGRTDVLLLPGAVGSGVNPTPLRVTSLGTARAPAFSPDGSLMAFLAIAPGGSGFDLWVVELTAAADGTFSVGSPRQITHDMALDPDSGLSWAP